MSSWPIRKCDGNDSADVEFKITLIRKPSDQIKEEDQDQMTWTKVGELILTPTKTPPVKIKGFTIRKLLKLKHNINDEENHEEKY